MLTLSHESTLEASQPRSRGQVENACWKGGLITVLAVASMTLLGVVLAAHFEMLMMDSHHFVALCAATAGVAVATIGYFVCTVLATPAAAAPHYLQLERIERGDTTLAEANDAVVAALKRYPFVVVALEGGREFVAIANTKVSDRPFYTPLVNLGRQAPDPRKVVEEGKRLFVRQNGQLFVVSTEGIEPLIKKSDAVGLDDPKTLLLFTFHPEDMICYINLRQPALALSDELASFGVPNYSRHVHFSDHFLLSMQSGGRVVKCFVANGQESIARCGEQEVAFYVDDSGRLHSAAGKQIAPAANDLQRFANEITKKRLKVIEKPFQSARIEGLKEAFSAVKTELEEGGLGLVELDNKRKYVALMQGDKKVLSPVIASTTEDGHDLPTIPTGKVLFAEIKGLVMVCQKDARERYTVQISEVLGSLEPLLVVNNFEYGTAVLQSGEENAIELAKALARPGLPVLYNDSTCVGDYRIWMVHSKEHEKVATFFVAGSQNSLPKQAASSQYALFLDDEKILCLMYCESEETQLAYVMYGQNHDGAVEHALDGSHQFVAGPKPIAE